MRRLYAAVPVFLLQGMILLLACGGCDDPVDLCGPQVSAGRIQGQVRTGGLPIDAEIAATRIVENTETESDFRAKPDDGGFYELDVPVGRYVVKLRVDGWRATYDYVASGLGYGNTKPDTVLVDGPHSPMKINFDLGGLTLRLDLSDDLDGQWGEVFLHRREEIEAEKWNSFVDGGGAYIVNGLLEVQIAGVLPGEYQVQIEIGYRENFWMPGTRYQTESPWYEVVVDSVVSLESELIAPPARIEGRIAGAWLDMGLIYNPELSIVNLDSTEITRPLWVEDDGTFAIDICLPGPVKIRVTQEGIEQWFGGPSFDEATVYTLQSGQTISDIELIQSGIHFYVNAPEGFVGAARFRLYDPVSLNLLASPYSSSADSRHIAIPNLWPGEFLISVSPGEWSMGSSIWKPQWFDRATGPEQARTISITTAGEVVGLELVLELGGVISGRVIYEEGSSGFYHFVLTTADEFSAWGNRVPGRRGCYGCGHRFAVTWANNFAPKSVIHKTRP
jgi:hypothetical protein